MAKLPSDVPTVVIPESFSKIKTPQTMEWYGINMLHNRHRNDYDCWFEMIYTYFGDQAVSDWCVKLPAKQKPC